MKYPGAGKPREGECLDDFLRDLKGEARRLEEMGDSLSAGDKARLEMVHRTIRWLGELSGLSPQEGSDASALITYKIAADCGERLRKGARRACGFWNRYIRPECPVVIRLGALPRSDSLVALAYRPFYHGETKFGVVEFNERFLETGSDLEIAGTVVHEIGHVLGIGWGRWNGLFHRETGRFRDEAVACLPSLAAMEVEREGTPHTALAHWDEEIFGKELMTGYRNGGEYVLPVTIDVMALLGHGIRERLAAPADLETLLEEADGMVFTGREKALALDREYYEQTDLFETIPHGRSPYRQ